MISWRNAHYSIEAFFHCDHIFLAIVIEPVRQQRISNVDQCLSRVGTASAGDAQHPDGGLSSA